VDWSMCNDSLVRRGEILLDFMVLEDWEGDVERMSAGGRGRPFTYPGSLIDFQPQLGFLFHLPTRQLKGFTRGLSKYVEGLRAPNYTTLGRRISRLNLNLDDCLVRSDKPST